MMTMILLLKLIIIIIIITIMIVIINNYYVCVCVHIYIYIYIERERERVINTYKDIPRSSGRQCAATDVPCAFIRLWSRVHKGRHFRLGEAWSYRRRAVLASICVDR